MTMLKEELAKFKPFLKEYSVHDRFFIMYKEKIKAKTLEVYTFKQAFEASISDT